MRFLVKAVVVIMLCSNLAFAHDETEKLEVECSHNYMSAGPNTFNQVIFSFSQKNLEAHDAINTTGNYSKFSVIAELINTKGETVKKVGSIGYEFIDEKISISQNYFPFGMVKTPEELSEMKADLGRHPKIKCYLIL